MTGMPRSRSMRVTVLLPDAIPPVSPYAFMAMCLMVSAKKIL